MKKRFSASFGIALLTLALGSFYTRNGVSSAAPRWDEKGPAISLDLPVHSGGAAAVTRGPQTQTASAVTNWNAIAIQVLPVDPGLILDSRAFAIMHAAIHDAVNGVERRYQPYTASLSSPGASIDAAVAAAARDVLAALSPGQQTVIEIAYAAALLAIPDGPAKDAGIALGQQSAAANLMRRVGDGSDIATAPAYVPTGKPGDYDFTPPFDQPPFGPVALFPGWGNVTPFGIEPNLYHLPGPDPLHSDRYAKDFNYVKSIGRLNSATRTAEQTDIALFWFEFSPMGWNRIANTIVRQKNADVWEAAQIMALVNFALADSYIAGFHNKYKFRFWRPYTAIRKAAEDGNWQTRPDPQWLSLHAPTFFIPPVPDYPSTHSVLGAAAAEVLIQNFGDRVRFKVTSTTLPGTIRRYDSLSQAAWENGMSRVYGGIHFQHAVHDGLQLGKEIGRAVSRLLPVVGR
ncbi:MAG: vanadium-dependent haloperoxidase [Acidobacteria bacterium]|nr:vanadium-dependent haloperoxidase [Acidobacteriota bacterium]